VPLFPGERAILATEEEPGSFFHDLVLTECRLGTGQPAHNLYFTAVPVEGTTVPTYVARPFDQWASSIFDQWWVYNPDADPYRHWIAQGRIDTYGRVWPPQTDHDMVDEDDLGNPSRVNVDLTDGDLVIGTDSEGYDVYAPTPHEESDLPNVPQEENDQALNDLWTSSWDANGSEPAAPPMEFESRDPEMKVTMTIDLDDGDVAEKEGLPAWEEHGAFHVLANENGTATIVEPVNAMMFRGFVRYRDKTSTLFNEHNITAAKATAEKCLANKPYKNAYEHLLAGSPFDEPDPVEPEAVLPEAVVDVPRPLPTKRVWKSVPISAGEDD
jgi:hypothetical protein